MRYSYTLVFLLIIQSGDVLARSNKTSVDTMTVFKDYEGAPRYPGGIQAFYQYVEDNVKWPAELYQHLLETQGSDHRFLVSFAVDTGGCLVDIKVLGNIGFGIADEVTRVLKASPKWTPGIQEKRKVKVNFTLPIDIPPPPLAIDEPLSIRSYPSSSLSDKKFPTITALNAAQMFPELSDKCNVDSFYVEKEKIALSDRYSILQYIKESIPTDSLRKLTGRIAFQLILNTSDSVCLHSYQDNLNIPFKNLPFGDALTQKTRWNLLTQTIGNQKAVSIILAITFTEDKIIYQHLSPNFVTGRFTELEISEQGKFGRY